jgi:hypothetical protein
MDRTAEAAGEARRALALARQIGDPAGELLALRGLSLDAYYAGDHDEAVRLARQAGQITAGIPGPLARSCSWVLTIVLAGAGNLAEAARRGGRPGPGPGRGDLQNQALLLPRTADLDLRAGRTGDATAHLREGLQIAVRTGSRLELRTGISQCGDLYAATGRAAEALTLWAACAAVDRHEGPTSPPWFVCRREEQLRQARLVLGPGRARAAEDRGAAMSLATAAECTLMLTDPGPPQPAAPDPGRSAPGSGSWSGWSPRAGPTPRSPPSCTSVSARLARTWTGSGTRPAAGREGRADLTRLALTTGLV